MSGAREIDPVALETWTAGDESNTEQQDKEFKHTGEFNMADLAQLEESIVGLSLLDAAELVKKLEARLGVSAAAAAPVMVAGGAAAGGAAAPAEEKTA